MAETLRCFRVAMPLLSARTLRTDDRKDEVALAQFVRTERLAASILRSARSDSTNKQLVLLGQKNVHSPVAGILKAWGRRLEQVSR
jgi:hypothetical protein